MSVFFPPPASSSPQACVKVGMHHQCTQPWWQFTRHRPSLSCESQHLDAVDLHVVIVRHLVVASSKQLRLRVGDAHAAVPPPLVLLLCACWARARVLLSRYRGAVLQPRCTAKPGNAVAQNSSAATALTGVPLSVAWRWEAACGAPAGARCRRGCDAYAPARTKRGVRLHDCQVRALSDSAAMLTELRRRERCD